MKRTYYCLHCASVLNPNVKIILGVAQGDQRGLALFSPQPGNYQTILASDLKLRAAELVDFSCPVCHADLTSGASPMLARIGFRRADGLEGWVDFARPFGERASYFVTEEQVRSYGEDAERYQPVNFFGAGREGEDEGLPRD